ncbi:hypothetical protein EMIT0158MI4_120079 [Burkholderia ambifaria]
MAKYAHAFIGKRWGKMSPHKIELDEIMLLKGVQNEVACLDAVWARRKLEALGDRNPKSRSHHLLHLAKANCHIPVLHQGERSCSTRIPPKCRQKQ